jgi:hypothetical protein
MAQYSIFVSFWCAHTLGTFPPNFFYRAGPGLKSTGLGRAWLFTLRAWAFAGLAYPGGRLGVWPAGLAQKPGPRGLRLLGYVVKARAWARSGPIFLLSMVPFYL